MPKRKGQRPEEETILQFKINPSTDDELVLRKTIQDAMEQTFGLTRAYTYFDITEIDQTKGELNIHTAAMYVSAHSNSQNS